MKKMDTIIFTHLLSELFEISFLLYIGLFLLENLLPGIVSNNLDLNLILLPVFSLGIANVFVSKSKDIVEKISGTSKYQVIGSVFSLLIAMVVWKEFRDMGTVGLVIAIVCGSLFLLLNLILQNEGKNEQI